MSTDVRYPRKDSQSEISPLSWDAGDPRRSATSVWQIVYLVCRLLTQRGGVWQVSNKKGLPARLAAIGGTAQAGSNFGALSQAKREAISRRTKEALAVAKSRGVKLGNPNGAAALKRAGKGGVALRATVAAIAEQHAADLAEVIAHIRATGATSLRAMAEALTARGMLTRRGGQWQVSNVRNLLARVKD
jgi:hypothetical protein